MTRSTRLLPLFLATLMAALPFSALAQSGRIGQVKTAAGEVDVVRGGQRLPLKIGDPIYEKDVIETGKDGSIGITFIDNSVFSTGPDSRLALDQFQFDSSNFKGAMLADMQKGTLNVVSGDIARSSPGMMRIKTPTAILGVRGTTFAVQVY
jgi:hypothetical protein